MKTIFTQMICLLRFPINLEVSIVTIGVDTSLGRGARAGMDGVNVQLRAREEEKRNHSVVGGYLTRREITHCGAMGPSMVAFLKEVYGAVELRKLTTCSCRSSQP